MTFQTRKLGIASAFSLLTVFSSFNAFAGPGALPKIPLFDTNQPVDPNIFYTIDDSGSMDWEIMFSPGVTSFTANQGRADVGGTRRSWMIPGWPTDGGGWTNSGVMPSLESNPDTWIFRNHIGNTLYYNTESNYTFWPGKTVGGTDLYGPALVTSVQKRPGTAADAKDITIKTANPYLPTFCIWDGDHPDNIANNTKIGIDEDDPHTCVKIHPDTDTSLYGQGRTYDEELQNFANWMQYYRKREYAAKFAIGTVINATDSAYMGLRLINSGHKHNLKTMTDKTNKSNLLSTYYTDLVQGGTWLRKNLQSVGEMFKGPNAILPQEDGGECQQNFNILMTDGFWNGDTPSGIGHEDGDGNTLFDGKTEEGNYGDTHSGTLADVAMYYYENDLRDDLLNKVPTKTGVDLNEKQHLVNYTIGFGLKGTLDPTTDPNEKNPATPFVWPQPVRDQPTTLDDLWHAAYNSRGLYLGANNSEELLNSLITAVVDITDRADTAAAAAVTSAQLTTDTIVYLARYNTVDWTGDVLAHKIQVLPNGAVDPTGKLEISPAWSAANKLGTRTAAREIITYDNSPTSVGGIPFKWDATGTPLTTAMQDDLKTRCVTSTSTSTTTSPITSTRCFDLGDKSYCKVSKDFWTNECTDQFPKITRRGKTQYYCYKPDPVTTTTATSSCAVEADDVGIARAAYIRGELSEIDAETHDFRPRPTITLSNGSKLPSLIGDVVNSGPVFVGAPNLNIPDKEPFPVGINGYSNYKEAQKGRTGVVYAGSNDGMFHAFIAENSTASSNDGGEELLAYIPSYLFSTDGQAGLHYLTDKTYSHMFYNDLTATVADVNISGSAWSTILVGGQRAGGQGYFALDVTNPDSFSETNAASIALWEFSSNDDPDLGYTYSRPQIGMLNDKTWVAIFGNGYNQDGADGMAKLFILKLSGPGPDKVWDLGTDYVKISTGSNLPSAPNGLATPALADIDVNGTIDRAYAGDLNGDLWVFDLSGNFTSLASVTSTKLFTTAGNRPITTQPNLAFHPSQPTTPSNVPNIMAYFGTGQFLVLDDKSDAAKLNKDYFYGVWDKSDANASNAGVQPTNLVQQTYTAVGRVLTKLPVDYQNPAVFGWTIALDDPGERSITNSAVRGDVVFFNSSVPTNEPCATNGYGYTWAVDLATGSSPDLPVLDTDDNGVLDGKDAADNGDVSGALHMDSFPTDNTFTDKVKFTGKDPLAIVQLTQPRLGRFSWQELLK